MILPHCLSCWRATMVVSHESIVSCIWTPAYVKVERRLMRLKMSKITCDTHIIAIMVQIFRRKPSRKIWCCGCKEAASPNVGYNSRVIWFPCGHATCVKCLLQSSAERTMRLGSIFVLLFKIFAANISVELIRLLCMQIFHTWCLVMKRSPLVP